MVLLSGLAVGLLFMVSNEVRAGGNGLEDNIAYYDAESGMEKLTADLSSLYQTSASPINSQIQNLINFPPTPAMVGTVTYTEGITYATDANGNPVTTSNTISSGPDQGLYAEIIPMTLQVNATRPTGASVNMTRGIEVALIPVFQFGVFCGYDCSYFAGPNFSFGGRVHTNGNLFLASGADLVFDDKVAAFGQIITDRLENGHLTSSGYGGTVYAPNASSGCPLNTFPPPGANCISLPSAIPGDASWSGGIPPLSTPLGTANPGFPSIAASTFNGFFVNGATGASNLQLPFVQNSCTSNPPPCTDPIQIIRKPLAGELSTSTIGQSREYNKAEIRILLADTQADLHPERGPILDGQDVQFTLNGSQAVATAFTTAGAAAGGAEYYAMANTSVDANWTPPINPATGLAYGWTSWPLLGELTTNPPTAPTNPGGVGAWIRVEYLNSASGKWVGITTQWLGYGFGRAYNTVLTAPNGSAGSNSINPNAILILQQLSPSATSPTGGATPMNNWYPINLYDPREGEMRDNPNGCAVNGIINAAELDVGNLALWLEGKGPFGAGAGKSVNLTNQNGYVLYFSDHRGMLTDPNASNGGATPPGVISGESGLEDVVNSTQPVTSNTPDGVKEAATYYTYSPEDVDQNGVLDNWGAANIGNGFGQNTKTPLNPYVQINAAPNTTFACNTTGQANAVTGARHALKLVDGGMSGGTSYLPVRWDNNGGGFTVVSENPVYVQGDYNSGVSDPFWSSAGTNTTTPHSAAAIIADAVSILSDNWTDLNSLNNPTALGNRLPSAQTYYRMAVAGGKNIPFPEPGWETSAGEDFGTDGGLHNFLRLLENWGSNAASPGNQAILNYDGSLVSMYYAEYNTGTFKCCTVVYGAPKRNFWFDTLFLSPANLPPGTPSFQDVVDLSYHQNYTPQ
jgi:hypothetical protein